MNFISTIKTIISIIPQIVAAIDALEAAVPQSGKGAAKLDVVKTVLQGAVEAADDIDNTSFEKLWPIVSKIVAAVIAMRKA